MVFLNEVFLGSVPVVCWVWGLGFGFWERARARALEGGVLGSTSHNGLEDGR